MSRARTRLHVIIREDCEEKRRVREKELAEKQDSDVEMLL
jgi:3'-phosphoadenosine 5'-phosphosulfate sulfotransferase